MENWNRASVIEWFRAHAHQAIRLRRRGTAFLVRGTAEGMEELDACAADFFTVQLVTGLPHLSIHLSFHEDALVVHVLGKAAESGDVSVSLTQRVAYGELLLGDAVSAPQDEPAEEPFFSPYELLR